MRVLLCIFLFCISTAVADSGRYLGVASCSSSNCHGSSAPREGVVLQNEFTTWHRHGKHSKAWKVLLEEDAMQIARHLGIQAAQKEPLCLSCHATHVPDEARRGEKYRIEDGVGCESCHGAAEGWLKTHAQSGITHKQNVENGLFDLTPLDHRARLCLSCHFGTDDKTVNHRLIGAGHPRLSFELDTFSMIQPRHWNLDADYVKRKELYIPAKAWLVGQVVLASEQMAALNSAVRSRNGSWPELSLFACYSCHHSLTGDQWKKRSYEQQPGELRLNLSSLRVVLRALSVIDPALGDRLHALILPLHEKYKAGDASDLVTSLQALLDGPIMNRVGSLSFGDADLRKFLEEIAEFATLPYFQYEEAEQILMGLSSVVASSDSLRERHQDDLKTLYQALRNDEAFVAEEFTEAAEKFLEQTRSD